MGPKRTVTDKTTLNMGQPIAASSLAKQISFSADKYFKGHFTASSYDMAERIAIALQVITNTVPEHDIVKKTTQEKVHELLDILSHLDALRDEHVLWDVMRRLRGIITNIELLKFSGVISPGVATLLVQAIEDLASRLHAASQGASSHSLITEEFFEARPVAKARPLAQSSTASQKSSLSARASSRGIIKRSSSAAPTAPRNASLHQGRRDRIIDILRIGPATITEVAARMPDCGPKTVQRELAMLVQERKVIAKGERRWRTYSLIETA